jgi:4-hydroxy-tetrahydrodipicolinate synthase
MPAVITPFDARHRVDIAAFSEILDWLISEGVHGLAVAGTTGEWQALTRRERCLLFDVARRHVPSDRPAIAGCSALRIEESKRYLRAAADAGFDAALLTVPPYVCPTEDEAIHYFRIMADLAPLPLIVYNWPQGTGIDLSVSALRISASHGNVIGIKNSTPDRTAFRQALDLIAGETLMFGVMPGKAGIDLMRNTQAAGCIGAAGVLARSQAGFFDAATRGDWTRAEQLGRHDERLMATFFSGFRGRYAHAISTLKFLLHERGLPAGTVRMPLRSIDSALAQRLSRLIDETGLFTDA